MTKPNPEGYDPRPIFDIRLVPLLEHYKSARAMKMASFKAALPDLLIAGTYLYAIVFFLNISPDLKSSMEGLTILELIVLIFFPIMFRVFATEEKAEFRASRKLRFMTAWINVFNILFVLAIIGELAFLTSMAEGRKWIPVQLFILIATKVYAVFFSGEKKVKPLSFCARLTARLTSGLFCGIFTYFFTAITVGLLLNPEMLSELSMLLAGYVFFVMMGIYTLYKQDFLYSLGPPANFIEKNSNQEMIMEIWYPRIEIPLKEYQVSPEANNLEAISDYYKKTKKKSRGMVVLLFCLLLPAVCLVPLRSKMFEHTKTNHREIHKNKFQWEERFNLGAGIVFGTCMLWILMVVIMMLIRENSIKTK